MLAVGQLGFSLSPTHPPCRLHNSHLFSKNVQFLPVWVTRGKLENAKAVLPDHRLSWLSTHHIWKPTQSQLLPGAKGTPI